MVLMGILIGPAKKETPGAAVMPDKIRAAPSPSAHPVPSPELSDHRRVIVSQVRDHTQGGNPELGCASGLTTTPILQTWAGVQCKVGSRGPSGRVWGNREQEGSPLFLSSQSLSRTGLFSNTPTLLDNLSPSTGPSC